jgi:hypothetical protein
VPTNYFDERIAKGFEAQWANLVRGTSGALDVRGVRGSLQGLGATG